MSASQIISDIIEDEIRTYIRQGLNVARAGTGTLSEAEQAKQAMIYEIRHLHLAEPWLPALRAASRINDVLLGREVTP